MDFAGDGALHVADGVDGVLVVQMMFIYASPFRVDDSVRLIIKNQSL